MDFQSAPVTFSHFQSPSVLSITINHSQSLWLNQKAGFIEIRKRGETTLNASVQRMQSTLTSHSANPRGTTLLPKGPSRTKKHYGIVNYYAVVFLLPSPPIYYAVNPSLRGKCLQNPGMMCQRRGSRHSKSLWGSKFTTRSKFTTDIFSTAGSFGYVARMNTNRAIQITGQRMQGIYEDQFGFLRFGA